MDLHDSKISKPGPNWGLRWLDGPILEHFQLDVVGFLAILGEDAVKSTSKLASLSWLFCLPRLLPAPHCLLYSERPEQHDVVRAKVAGIYSGLRRDELSSVAAALFGSMPAYSVRCFDIRRKEDKKSHGPSRLHVNYTAPMVLVNLFGCALSITLFILSLVYGDGFSLVATILLSLLSTLIGITTHWSFEIGPLPRRPLPGSDTVVRYPNGSFLVVKCDEDVARELLFPQNEINYTLRWSDGFMFVSLLGTLTLMVSVIVLANARIELQLAWGGAFILLNIGHWLAAALPKGINWRFSEFHFREYQTTGGSANPNFTGALWKAIAFTKNTDWIPLIDAMPKTEIWTHWLAEATTMMEECHVGVGTLPKRHSSLHSRGTIKPTDGVVVYDIPNWDPKAAWDRIFQSKLAASTAASAV